MSNGYGPQLPLNQPGDGGYSLLENYKQVAAQNLKMIVLTEPGERIMKPNFGVGIRSYLFKNETDNFNSIQTKIKSQVAKYLSWVSIDAVQISNTPDSQMLMVRIVYSIPAIGGTREEVLISIN